MSSLAGLRAVQSFAAALDRCDFDEAARYIAADCRYEIGNEVLLGPAAIIASYRESAEWAASTLDEVAYESDVRESSDGFNVTFIDRIVHRGQRHEYRARQRVRLNAAGLVAIIVHEELVGEKEKLEAFFASVGVSRK